MKWHSCPIARGFAVVSLTLAALSTLSLAVPAAAEAQSGAATSVGVLTFDTAGVEAGYGAYVADRICLDPRFIADAKVSRLRETPSPRPSGVRALLGGTVAKLGGFEIVVVLTSGRAQQVALSRRYTGDTLDAAVESMIGGLHEVVAALTGDSRVPIAPPAGHSGSVIEVPRPTTADDPPAADHAARPTRDPRLNIPELNGTTAPSWYPLPPVRGPGDFEGSAAYFGGTSAEQAKIRSATAARVELALTIDRLVGVTVTAYVTNKFEGKLVRPQRYGVVRTVRLATKAKGRIADQRVLEAEPDGTIPAYTLARISFTDVLTPLVRQLQRAIALIDDTHVVDEVVVRQLLERAQAGEYLSRHAPGWALVPNGVAENTIRVTAFQADLTPPGGALINIASTARQELSRWLFEAMRYSIARHARGNFGRELTPNEAKVLIAALGRITVPDSEIMNNYHRGGLLTETYAVVTVPLDVAATAVYAEFLRRHARLGDGGGLMISKDDLTNGIRDYRGR